MKVDDTEILHSVGETVLISGSHVRYIVETLIPRLDSCGDKPFDVSIMTVFVYLTPGTSYPYLTVEYQQGISSQIIWQNILSPDTREELTQVLCQYKIPGDAIEEALNFKTLICRCVY